MSILDAILEGIVGAFEAIGDAFRALWQFLWKLVAVLLFLGLIMLPIVISVGAGFPMPGILISIVLIVAFLWYWIGRQEE